MKSLLSILLLGATAVAQTTVAHVNDPVSPGTLGDNLLSLDEAIRLVNTTLTPGQLSLAERGQITGAGAPTVVEIDAAAIPTITLQQDLSPLDGPAMGVDVAIRGVNGRPILDASGRNIALRIRSNSVDVTNLAFHNGTDGVVADASVYFQMMRQLLLDGLEFTGQTGVGVRFQAAGASARTMAMLSHSSFRSLATAIVIDDRSAGGAVMVDVEYVVFDGVQLGTDLFIDASGAMTMCRLWRCKMPVANQAVKIRRGAGSDKRCMLMLVASEFVTSGDTVDAAGNALVETAVHVHHSVFRPATGRRAFLLGPSDARIDWHLSENIIYGDCDVAEGRLNRRLWAWNNIFRDGVISIDNRGTTTNFRWNRFERCTIRALAASTTPMRHVSSEFDSCTIDGQSFLGDVRLENCFLNSTTLLGSVSQQSPAPSPWLANTWASSETPAVGTHIDLTLDMPHGMLGVWELGLPDSQLVLTREPWRAYAFPGPRLGLAGIYAYRSTVRVPIPTATG